MVEYGYDGALDRPSRSSAPAAAAPRPTRSRYDGDKTTGITATGTAAGAFTFGYDANGFLTLDEARERRPDADHRADPRQGRRADRRRAVRDRPRRRRRRASAITGAGLSETLEQDGAGRLKSRTLTASGTQRYKLVLARSGDGKIARRTETVDGATHVFDYHYDDDGQLTQVERDDAGRALQLRRQRQPQARQLGEGALETAAFDDEDRLTARGATAFTYDGAGFLASRGGDTFDYSARGELLSATVGGVPPSATATTRSAAASRASRARRSRSTCTATRATRCGSPRRARRRAS